MLTVTLIKQHGRSYWEKCIKCLSLCIQLFKPFELLQSLCTKVLLLSFYSFSTFCGQELSRERGSGSSRVPGENSALPGMPCCQSTEAFNSFSCAEIWQLLLTPASEKKRRMLFVPSFIRCGWQRPLFSSFLHCFAGHPSFFMSSNPLFLPVFLEVMGWRLDCRVWRMARLIWNNGAL